MFSDKDSNPQPLVYKMRLQPIEPPGQRKYTLFKNNHEMFIHINYILSHRTIYIAFKEMKLSRAKGMFFNHSAINNIRDN